MSSSHIVRPGDSVPVSMQPSLPKASSKWEGRHLDELKVDYNPELVWEMNFDRDLPPDIDETHAELDAGI